MSVICFILINTILWPKILVQAALCDPDSWLLHVKIIVLLLNLFRVATALLFSVYLEVCTTYVIYSVPYIRYIHTHPFYNTSVLTKYIYGWKKSLMCKTIFRTYARFDRLPEVLGIRIQTVLLNTIIGYMIQHLLLPSIFSPLYMSYLGMETCCSSVATRGGLCACLYSWMI